MGCILPIRQKINTEPKCLNCGTYYPSPDHFTWCKYRGGSWKPILDIPIDTVKPAEEIEEKENNDR